MVSCAAATVAFTFLAMNICTLCGDKMPGTEDEDYVHVCAECTTPDRHDENWWNMMEYAPEVRLQRLRKCQGELQI